MKKKPAKKSPKLMTLPKGNGAYAVIGYQPSGPSVWYFADNWDDACKTANDKGVFDLSKCRRITLVVGQSVEPKPQQTVERVR